MSPRRRRWVVALLALLALVGVGVWAVIAWWPEPRPGEYPQGKRSINLAADLKRMWETEPMRGTTDPSHGPNPRASTDRAINAAYRVFNTVELVGKTRDEVVELLGDPVASSDSCYRSPYAFWPPPPDAMVYCFTNGAYGRQFDITFDGQGRVDDVKMNWIH